VLVAGPVLAIVRQALESERLAALVEQSADGAPAVALQDGTLMLGTLEGAGLEQWLQATLLPRLLVQYDRLRQRGVPLAAYTSRPRHSDVTNALRLWACPQRFPDCQHGCAFRDEPLPDGARLCRTLANLPDRALFQSLLKSGERSALCRSQWAVSLRHYGVHRLHFFYVHAGPEVARVEVPEWVADDAHLLDLVHAAVVDQCRRGRGYPTALLEAHEQAVLRGPDRRQFEAMLETALIRAGLPGSTSEKERGKRLRAL
jgi:GNAT superfamily N-acetyltransferase